MADLELMERHETERELRRRILLAKASVKAESPATKRMLSGKFRITKRSVGMDWQPIETAPRDGSEVIVGKANDWMAFFHVPYPLPARFQNGRWRADFGVSGWRPFEPQPTHWKPTT